MDCCARCLRGSLGGWTVAHAVYVVVFGWTVAHAVYVVVLMDGCCARCLRGSLGGWTVAHAVYGVVLVDGLLRTLSTW